MSTPRSRPAISRVQRSSTCANPAPPQVENNRKSTDRQYALAAKARELGWPADARSARMMNISKSGVPLQRVYVAENGAGERPGRVSIHPGQVGELDQHALEFSGSCRAKGTAQDRTNRSVIS